MAFSKEKTITVTVDDFIDKESIYHEEFTGKNGEPCLVQVLPDTDAVNPREDCDHLWTWSTTRNAGYTDKGAVSLTDIEEYELEENEDHAGPSKAFLRDYLVFPLYLYRHSGDVISTSIAPFKAFDSAGWDSGCMGVAYLEKKKALKEYGWKKLTPKRVEKLRGCLKGEVEEMNAWLEGSVYGIQVIDMQSEKEESCWNYICCDRDDIKNAAADMLHGWTATDEERHEIAERLVA